MTFEALLALGLHPAATDVPTIRAVLADETTRERAAQGEGDTEVMRLAAAQLFAAGTVDDAILIWRAKRASMDAACSIDIELLCGRGLDETLKHLDALGDDDGASAAQALRTTLDGDFDAVDFMAHLTRYYGDG